MNISVYPQPLLHLDTWALSPLHQGPMRALPFAHCCRWALQMQRYEHQQAIQPVPFPPELLSIKEPRPRNGTSPSQTPGSIRDFLPVCACHTTRYRLPSQKTSCGTIPPRKVQEMLHVPSDRSSKSSLAEDSNILEGFPFCF